MPGLGHRDLNPSIRRWDGVAQRIDALVSRPHRRIVGCLLLARSVRAGTHGVFPELGYTGCAIRLPATAALDPKRTLKALKAKSLRCRWRYLGRTMPRQ